MSTHEHGSDDCVDYIERIVYFIDNELDQADCAVVEMHLRECGPCLERYDLQRPSSSSSPAPAPSPPRSRSATAYASSSARCGIRSPRATPEPSARAD